MIKAQVTRRKELKIKGTMKYQLISNEGIIYELETPNGFFIDKYYFDVGDYIYLCDYGERMFKMYENHPITMLLKEES